MVKGKHHVYCYVTPGPRWILLVDLDVFVNLNSWMIVQCIVLCLILATIVALSCVFNSWFLAIFLDNEFQTHIIFCWFFLIFFDLLVQFSFFFPRSFMLSGVVSLRSQIAGARLRRAVGCGGIRRSQQQPANCAALQSCSIAELQPMLQQDQRAGRTACAVNTWGSGFRFSLPSFPNSRNTCGAPTQDNDRDMICHGNPPPGLTSQG